MKRQITLTMKENIKIKVVQEVMEKKRTVVEAAVALDLSERQVYRVLSRIRAEGALAVAHGNRGVVSSRRIEPCIRERVLKLRLESYPGFNDRHFTDELKDEEGIKIGRESVRKLLRRAGIPSVRPVKKRKHRLRRTPKEQFGEMLQGDSSSHDWLEGRGPWLDLVHFVDDATGFEWANFYLEETTQGYFEVIMEILTNHGIPSSVYVDKHSIFRVNREDTQEEQLSGRRPRTTFGRAMEDLGIRMIFADSPEAKGRVERAGGVHQDRLVSELRKAKASTLEEARTVLRLHLKKHNRRFSRKPQSEKSAFISLPANCDLKQILCWKEERTVANDNTISFQGKLFQIPKSPLRSTWAKCKVSVHLCLDGSLHAFYQRERIAYFKNIGVDWKQLPIAPQNTKALSVHSPQLTFLPGH